MQRQLSESVYIVIWQLDSNEYYPAGWKWKIKDRTQFMEGELRWLDSTKQKTNVGVGRSYDWNEGKCKIGKFIKVIFFKTFYQRVAVSLNARTTLNHIAW